MTQRNTERPLFCNSLKISEKKPFSGFFMRLFCLNIPHRPVESTGFILKFLRNMHEHFLKTKQPMSTMNQYQFFKLVRAMRSAQKMYFKNRSHDDLRKSKALEKRVDEEIMRVNKLFEDFQEEINEQPSEN